MKVTRYFIDTPGDEATCIVCGKTIELDEVSYEFRPDKGVKATKEEISKTWCKDCLPKDVEVYKGTQLRNCTEYRKNLKRGIR